MMGGSHLMGWEQHMAVSRVRWHFDRGSEGRDRNTMINDIRSGLATLEPHTGLKFVEIDNADSADLNFRWGT